MPKEGNMPTVTISIKQGETVLATLTGNKVPVATGALAMQIRPVPDSTTVLFSATDTTYLTGSTGSTGAIVLAIPGGVSASIRAGAHRYDIKHTSTTGTITRVYEGPVYVDAAVTR
jgi:hypothetical protein